MEENLEEMNEQENLNNNQEKMVNNNVEEETAVNTEEVINNEERIPDPFDELDKLKGELEDVKDRHTRLIAEFDNLKKRNAKERELLYNSIMADVVKSLLPVIDNLEKAVNSECKDEEYRKGVEMCLDQFKEVLKTNGVTEIEAVGKPFDPELHEAISMIQDPNLGEKIIAQEYRKGYKIGNRVIRHSLVIVAN